MADIFSEFLNRLSSVEGFRADRAVLIVSGAKIFANKPTLTIKEICDFFEKSHLARPNSTILLRALTDDRRVSVRQKNVRSLAKSDTFLRETFPDFFEDIPHKLGSLSEDLKLNLASTPLIDDNFVADLEKMLGLYATLHVLENSMRRLIEQVLKEKNGENWWDITASAPLKRKHADRITKEQSRKWLPARSSLGPLYSLDWSDLISIIRKFESDFIPIIGEIDFLHRYSDLGLVRHVVAHHGFVDNPKDYERAHLALHDWQNQVGHALTPRQ